VSDEYLDKYITSEKHNALPLANLYHLAMEELALPAPAVKMGGFPAFNSATGGFRPREFTIVCGSTGSGKTTLMANWSAEFINLKIPHFVASVETGPTDFIKRVISVMVEEDWNTGDPISPELLKNFHVEHGSIIQETETYLSLYENRFSVEELMSNIAWHVKHKKCKIAIIDNLNFFLEVTAARDALIEMDRVIHELIIFCKKVDVHIVMIMHPKKQDHGRVESEFDVKGSATAVQEAHNVLLFNRPHPELIKSGRAESDDREIKIAKMRRKGKFVGRRLVIKSIAGVKYVEKCTV
jgi:replicative DNA helicase